MSKPKALMHRRRRAGRADAGSAGVEAAVAAKSRWEHGGLASTLGVIGAVIAAFSAFASYKQWTAADLQAQAAEMQTKVAVAQLSPQLFWRKETVKVTKVSDNDDFNLHLLNAGGPIYDLRVRRFVILDFYKHDSQVVRYQASVQASDYLNVEEPSDKDRVVTLMGMHQSERLDRLAELIHRVSGGQWSFQRVETSVDLKYRDALNTEHLERYRVTASGVRRVQGEDFERLGWTAIFGLDGVVGGDPTGAAKHLMRLLEDAKQRLVAH